MRYRGHPTRLESRIASVEHGLARRRLILDAREGTAEA
jgi:hypothetical protein